MVCFILFKIQNFTIICDFLRWAKCPHFTTLDRRQTYIRDDLHWKTTFNERTVWVEDNFDWRSPWIKDNIRWRMTVNEGPLALKKVSCPEIGWHSTWMVTHRNKSNSLFPRLRMFNKWRNNLCQCLDMYKRVSATEQATSLVLFEKVDILT